MKAKNTKLVKYILSILTIITITACGGGSSGESNNCDIYTKDSDKDGIEDRFDFAPNDPFENGKYYKLENVVNSEGVKRILKIAKERGVDVNLQLGNNPPKLNGYYKSESGGYVYYANNSPGGRMIGDIFVTTESILCTTQKYTKERANSPLGISESAGKIRGEGRNFSIYDSTLRKYSDECTGYLIYISSGKVAKESGDIKNYKVIIASLGYEETTPGACDIYKGAKRTEEVYTTRDMKKVKDLDELEYMCVDEGKAYVPTETWKNKDKESCKCTANIEIECE